MKRAISIVTALLGLGLLLLGLLFLAGWGGESRRLVIGAVSLAVGAGLTGLGLLVFRRADLIAPARLRAEILDLARRRAGEISRPDLDAFLGRRAPHAVSVIEQLQAEGVCSHQGRDGTPYLVFPDIQPRLVVPSCEFCGSELPLETEVTSCPSCGGSVQTDIERLSLSREDHYHMDE